MKDIDTVIMGWNTYHQIVTELSPDEWVYDDFITYVVTHKPKTSSEKIRFVNETPVELIKRLREENGSTSFTSQQRNGGISSMPCLLSATN